MQSQSNNGYAACFSPHTGLPLVTSHLRQPRNKFTDTRCMVFRMVYTKTQANNFRTLRYIRFCSAKASAKSDFAHQRPSQNPILPVKGLRKIRFCPSKAFAKSDFARQRPSQNPNRIILGCHTALNCVQVSKNSAADLLPAAQIAFKKRKYRFQNLLRYSCPARPAVFGYRA